MKTKQIIRNIFRLCSVIGILALIVSWNRYGKFVMAANSVKQLNEHFYYMDFSGDYHLKEYLENGGCKNNAEMADYLYKYLKGQNLKLKNRKEVPLNTGCAVITARTSNDDNAEHIFGRNYDWDNLTSAIIIHSKPKHGYESISTVQLDFLGFGDGFRPDSFGHKYLSIAGLFVPLDGMNEKGLCISDLMAGDKEETNQNRGKSSVTTTLAIRGILDFCASVPEAIAFLEDHDMHSVIGYAHHFAISDIYGNSVVVEYVNNEMVVTDTNAVTNHYLAANKVQEKDKCSVIRLDVLDQKLEETGGIMNEEQVFDALRSIRAGQYGGTSKTWWHEVFSQEKLTVNYTFMEDYENKDCFTFRFKNRNQRP